MEHRKYLGKVALIGRVNVGKSTLFNHLAPSKVIFRSLKKGGLNKYRRSGRTRHMNSHGVIESPQPGATRDRLYGRCVLDDDHLCELIDCGGYEGATSVDYWQQSMVAIAESRLVLFLVDGSTQAHPLDLEIGLYLKKKQIPTIYIMTKQDNKLKANDNLGEFYNRMPYLRDLLPISATTGIGIAELKQRLVNQLCELGSQSQQKIRAHTSSLQKEALLDVSQLSVAIVGKPNSGKSSLLNALVSEQRSCVAPEAGTTRDPVDVEMKYYQKYYRIIDTAGVRRRTKVSGHLEKISVSLSLHAIQEAHMTILVIDAAIGMTDQDAKIAARALAAFKPLLIVISKWDLMKGSILQQDYTKNLRQRHLSSHRFVPITFISSVTKYGVSGLRRVMANLTQMAAKRVSTSLANQALQTIVAQQMPHVISSFHKRIKFYFITQVSVYPPTFVIKCNVATSLKESYKSYVSKSLQQELGFDQIPIRIFYRGKTDHEAGEGLAEQRKDGT
ncbi:MAG: ribosome biogenesis GTPase Der [Proteobacteria bacterium]|nr:ribosome biogenesis GTPase Der [Pseudomonadota bacterium]